MEQKEYFNVKIEFNKQKVDSIIEETIIKGGKGYVCSVEGNILANTYANSKYLMIVNNSLVNICDGGSIAFFASIFHRKKFSTYIGADLFLNYIKQKNYRYFFLGNTIEVLAGLKNNLIKLNPTIQHMCFETLPFEKVENFNYRNIAEMINKDNPDIIWLSLGAPKQEEFMFRLLPYLNRGIMFGFGAIFDFNAGVNKIRRAPKLFLLLKLEWIYRLIKEPRKQGKRVCNIFKVYPQIIVKELIK
jgi:N-acetylglucosaminyldiphosphoundecaprenol N-acetyl-beta-D-mannosaminyltransferase